MNASVSYDSERMQSNLFGTPTPTNGFRDSSFAKNKTLRLHRWVPWVAGFSAEFVEDCIGHYLPQASSHSWVLDPFAGVGTTLVESYMRGLNVIGFEINPYAALAAKLKVQALDIPLKPLRQEVTRFERFMQSVENGLRKRAPHSKAPTGFKGRTQLFSPRVERKVLYALDFVGKIDHPIVKEIFLLGLGSVMISFSNYSYEPSLTRRAAVGKADILEAKVGRDISTKLRLMLEDIEWAQELLKSSGHQPTAKVFSKSIFSAPDSLDHSRHVDLIVTSPPYLNNYHYPRNTRPQLHWLGFTSGTGYNGAGEGQSFGKFWQTVRDGDPVGLSFEMPELLEIVEVIRNRNTGRGCYGGPGWANYVATYFNDAHQFCKLAAELLRPGSVAVIVLGNSVIQGIEVKTDHFFGRIGELAGLTFEDNHLLRRKRTGNSIIQSSVRVDQAAEKTVLYESAIVLRKAG